MLRFLVVGALLAAVSAHELDEATWGQLLREQGFSDDDIEVFVQVIYYSLIRGVLKMSHYRKRFSIKN